MSPWVFFLFTLNLVPIVFRNSWKKVGQPCRRSILWSLNSLISIALVRIPRCWRFLFFSSRAIIDAVSFQKRALVTLHTMWKDTQFRYIAKISFFFIFNRRKKRGERAKSRGNKRQETFGSTFFREREREQPCNLMRFIQYLRSKLIFSEARS